MALRIACSARTRWACARPTALPASTPAPAPASALASASASALLGRRRVHDFVRGTTPDGTTYKVPLSSPKVVGQWTSRGQRAYQEDTTAVCALNLDRAELARSLPPSTPWDGNGSEGKVVEYFGIFDGHGGRHVSQFLSSRLAELVESVSADEIPAIIEDTEALGGYFHRWRGGALRRWSKWAKEELPGPKELMTIEERLTLAFLKADQIIRAEIQQAEHCGSTASVVLVHSLDDPAQPHFASQRLHLTVAQAGDTRVLLCNTKLGEVTALTEKHHAEARVEADRLRRMGTDRLITDSFGESRWMGAIENTRGFGDTQWKSSGVTAEPEVSTLVIDGTEHAYLVMVTDGLTSMLSDQELVDLARRAADPARAAKTIVHFGEDLGARDNCTCIVVPLAGWGQVGGDDLTEARREYRRKQAEMYNTRMQRM